MASRGYFFTADAILFEISRWLYFYFVLIKNRDQRNFESTESIIGKLC